MPDSDNAESRLDVPDDVEHGTLKPAGVVDGDNGRSPDSLREDLFRAIEAYQEPEAQINQLQELVDNLVRTNRPDAAAYVAKLTQESLYNNIWQGRTITGTHDLFFFVRRASSLDNAIREAKARLHPPAEGGFEAMLIFEREANGWVPRYLYHYDDSDVPERLRDADISSVEMVSVPRPTRQNRRLADPASIAVDPELLTVDEVLLHLEEAKNVVLEGPPGTGKSRMALEVVDRLSNGLRDETRLSRIAQSKDLNSKREEIVEAPLVWEMIQFHASYSYEDFVRGLRLDPEAGGYAMTPVDGILPRMAQVAKMRAGRPTLLIVDEVNRASLPAVLGEAVFALDPAHRGRSVRLQYGTPGAHSLTVPSNLFFLGTMNTADRSISLTDVAIRRRFRFLAMNPSMRAIEDFYRGFPNRLEVVKTLFEGASDCVKDSSLQAGHSYFLIRDSDTQSHAEWAASVAVRLVYEVRPLMVEYQAEGLSVGPWRLQLDQNQADIDLLEADVANVQRGIELLLGSVETAE